MFGEGNNFGGNAFGFRITLIFALPNEVSRLSTWIIKSCNFNGASLLGAGIQGLRNLPVFGLTTDPHPIWTLFLCQL